MPAGGERMRQLRILILVVTGCPQAVRQTESLCSKCGGIEQELQGVKDMRNGLPGPARNRRRTNRNPQCRKQQETSAFSVPVKDEGHQNRIQPPPTPHRQPLTNNTHSTRATRARPTSEDERDNRSTIETERSQGVSPTPFVATLPRHH